MELFDKKFVHFMWDDKLEEKEGFFADDICELTNCVLDGNLHFAKVRKSLSPAFPFKDTNNNDWLFFYYDPNYGIKKAHMEGTQVQYRFNDTERWHDISESDIADIKRTGLSWFDYDCEYRIKPKELIRMTYRQLAEWLAKGNGQARSREKASLFINIVCTTYENNKEVPSSFRLLRWDSDEWIEPTLDVYLEDCRKGV